MRAPCSWSSFQLSLWESEICCLDLELVAICGLSSFVLPLLVTHISLGVHVPKLMTICRFLFEGAPPPPPLPHFAASWNGESGGCLKGRFHSPSATGLVEALQKLSIMSVPGTVGNLFQSKLRTLGTFHRSQSGVQAFHFALQPEHLFSERNQLNY